MYSKKNFFSVSISIYHYYTIFSEFGAKTDSIIKTEFGDINGPGGVFMITKDGKPVYKKAFENQIWN